MRSVYIITFLLIIMSIVGCGRDNRWEFVTTKDGLVYRINNETGETSLIVGTQSAKVEETISVKSSDSKTNHILVWPAIYNAQLGGLTLQLKTNWRDGKLLYIFSESPDAGLVKMERAKLGSSARFTVNFYDQDGFQILTIPIALSEMVSSWNDKQTIGELSMNSSYVCSLETYEAIKVWNVGWGGFASQ